MGYHEPPDTASYRDGLTRRQYGKLCRLLELLHREGNAFQKERIPASVRSLDDFKNRVPLTTKRELVEDHASAAPFGRNLTYPLERYTRFCQTSGTSGEPMPWLDTPESWASMLTCWREVYQAAGLAHTERVFFAFSFGPFLGFWTAFDAAVSLGYLCIPGGGMSTDALLRTIERFEATTLCCTPTYAMRLGSLMRDTGLTLPSVRRIIVAGEPGGSIPATRETLTNLWGEQARIVDHHGLTEVGPVSVEHPDHPGTLAVLEEHYLAEVLDPNSLREVAEGETGELVLTTLDRDACPLIRYRTGDLVRKRFLPQLGLEGGILGRIDDMVVVRGVNVFPSAIEGIVRHFDDIAEYQVVETCQNAMVELSVEIELRDASTSTDVATRLETALRRHFQLRIPVKALPSGSLPRYEFKAKRWKKASPC